MSKRTVEKYHTLWFNKIQVAIDTVPTIVAYYKEIIKQ
jgi:hypothetical protein